MVSKTVAMGGIILSAAAALATLAPHLVESQCQAQMGISTKPAREQLIERRTAAALNKNISLDLNEMPLNDVAELFGQKLGVICMLDLRAIEEPGLDGTTAVTFKTATMTAGRALNQLLASLDESLTWLVRGEVLLITTRTRAYSQENYELRVYPVRDLAEVQEGNEIEEDYDTLIDLITSTIAPDTWGDAPGQGSIKQFDNAHVLVVSHLPETQIAIAQLLKTLRTVRAVQDGDDALLHRLQREDELSAPSASPHEDSGPQPSWRMPRVYR